MARSHRRDPSIDQDNDASCINNNRGMARRAKRQSNKTDRQLLKQQLRQESWCTQEKFSGNHLSVSNEDFDF